MSLRTVTVTHSILDRNGGSISYEVWSDNRGITVCTYGEDGKETDNINLFWEEVPDMIILLTEAMRNHQ